jgi:hypothetical protein
MIQRAAPERPLAAEPAGPSTPHEPTASRSTGGPAPNEDADLDRLADEVFGRLRWRLLAERERTMGGA